MALALDPSILSSSPISKYPPHKSPMPEGLCKVPTCGATVWPSLCPSTMSATCALQAQRAEHHAPTSGAAALERDHQLAQLQIQCHIGRLISTSGQDRAGLRSQDEAILQEQRQREVGQRMLEHPGQPSPGLHLRQQLVCYSQKRSMRDRLHLPAKSQCFYASDLQHVVFT